MRKEKTIKLQPNAPTEFKSLPAELHGTILSYLKLSEIKPFLLCSAQSYKILTSNYLFWLKKYDDKIKEDFIFFRKPTSFIARLRQKYLNRRYLRDCIKEVRYDVHTDQTDITQIIFNNDTNRVFVSSDDQTIKIISDNNIIGSLIGHHGGVWTFDVHGNVLVSGSTDKTLRIWNIEKRICLGVLKGHKSTVRCLRVTDDYVISGGRDAEVRIWNLNGDCLHILKGHRESVRCLDIKNTLLVTGSYDGSVILWDYKRGEMIKHLKTHTSRVYCVKISDDHIVSSGQCANIYVSDISGNLKFVLKAHRSVVPLLEINGDFLISAGADKLCIKWDLKEGKMLFELHRDSHITVMRSCNDLLVLGTNTSVDLIDLKTGNFIRNIIDNKNLIYDAAFSQNDIVIGFKDKNGVGITKFSYKKI